MPQKPSSKHRIKVGDICRPFIGIFVFFDTNKGVWQAQRIEADEPLMVINISHSGPVDARVAVYRLLYGNSIYNYRCIPGYFEAYFYKDAQHVE